MVDEVKIENRHFPINNQSETKVTRPTTSASQDVMISSQLNALMRSLPEDTNVQNEAHVKAIQQQIKQDTYTIDLDSLSAKLMETGLLSKLGD